MGKKPRKARPAKRPTTKRPPKKRAAPRARPGEVGKKTGPDAVAVQQNGGGDPHTRSSEGEKPDKGEGGAPPNLSTIPAGATQPGALSSVQPAPSGAVGKATIETDAATAEGKRPSGQLADSQ